MSSTFLRDDFLDDMGLFADVLFPDMELLGEIPPVPTPVADPPVREKIKRKRGEERAGVPEEKNNSKKKKKNTAYPSDRKKKKKREVLDPSALFLKDPAMSQNGVLTFDTPIPNAPRPTEIVPLRSEHNGRVLTKASDQHLWLSKPTEHSTERPLIDLMKTVHAPRTGSESSVPLAEALLTMVNEFNANLETMHTIRAALRLPTGLEHAAFSVRMASGLSGVVVDEEMKEAERTNKLPVLVGIPANTLTKTRQTWKGAGQLMTPHGYAHESCRRATFHVTSRYNEDKAKLYQKFFAQDPKCEEAGFMLPSPEDYPMYHRLKREYGHRFARRDEFLNKAAMNVPRTVNVEVSRRYLRKFRFPVRHRPDRVERECVRGERCSILKRMRKLGCTRPYIGREFLLPEEDRLFEEKGTLPREHGMCYDCEIKAYYKSVYSREANKRRPDMSINRFTVRCEKGEFSDADMLDNIIHGDVVTGITGYVPRYNINDRALRSEAHPEDPTFTPVTILADTSQLF